ncbi:SsgA family sporulation/cell division regulator [Kutzneria chonburiensis]|uniref:SsgA family sporulation/cell division regulator n=1 Tax=Kutzneria chonburiensis TaxID=1483604 RepID=A0ABV6MP07_9PSEU|nr:SsgA family sporulation/cell division regulator [Kutzneria chonburiensis]
MRNNHRTLRSTVTLDLLVPQSPPVGVKVDLRYDTRDPYAVTAAFRAGPSGCVEWCFARDLLADGLIEESGVGDVRIGPAADAVELVVLVLSAPAGLAVFEGLAEDLAEFLDRTYDVVLPGTESCWVSVDDALSTLASRDPN